MNLQSKVILLTGATGGIGEAIAKQLAKHGTHLILVGRSTTELQRIANELQIAKHHGFTLQADIATHAGRETIRTALIALQIPVDIFIHCAGINLFGLLEDNMPEAIEQLISTNITATILLTRLILPFLHKKQGRILMIGSSFGRLGFPGFATYCASKFAIRGFTEALRRELADSAIQIAYIAPRATNTSLNTQAIIGLNNALGNKVDEPIVVATAIEDLLLQARIYDINLGWPEKLFLRINSIFPRFIDIALRKKLPIIRRFAH